MVAWVQSCESLIWATKSQSLEVLRGIRTATASRGVGPSPMPEPCLYSLIGQGKVLMIAYRQWSIRDLYLAAAPVAQRPRCDMSSEASYTFWRCNLFSEIQHTPVLHQIKLQTRHESKATECLH